MNSPKPARHIVISGTNFWNPGDDFVRDGVIAVLQKLFPECQLNFLFYNFNADFFPQEKFSGISNLVACGDLDRYREFVDAVVIAGLSAGDEIKDLYRWILANQLQDRVYLIGAGYENDYVAKHVSQEPEKTIFANARIITGRTRKTPAWMQRMGLPYHHLNCPALLSVPRVKDVAPGKQIQRIGFSIQLPHGEGIVNQCCERRYYELARELLLNLAKDFDVEVIAHHKSEYFHFLHLLRGRNIPVIFSSFYHDLFETYPRYDLVVTTRLHAGLFANGHGIPSMIVNDTDRHTHTMEGFPHSVCIRTRADFVREFERLRAASLSEIASTAAAFKSNLIDQYCVTLAPVFKSIEHDYSFDSELKEQALVRAVIKPGMTVFDVGANIGKYTKLFCSLLGPQGRVFAFEPSPGARERLQESLGEFGNVTVLPFAICDQQGDVTLHQFPEEYCSWNSLGRPQMPDPRDPSRLVPIIDAVTVPATTLDQFCHARGVDHIDYLKLDVEGAELRALSGARDLLRRKAIGYLQFEISQKMLEGLSTTAKPVFDFLQAEGYECHAIMSNGAIGEAVHDSTAFYENYIAMPASRTVSSDPLPVHFFTIVLNGFPFIQHHIEQFKQLPFEWHWHIIEGVAELNHDTAWSKQFGGRIPTELHQDGRSNDGTTAYLDELAAKYPCNITVYRKPLGQFWDGKLEMVNAPLQNIQRECLLWQVDADELWTAEQISFARRLFVARPDKTAAFYYCHYFLGRDLVISTRDTYGNHTAYEWLRTWRYKPGCRWTAHEPPQLCCPNEAGTVVDVATINPFRHKETEALDLVFQHFAYATEGQLRFKETYYGYADALSQWRRLQANQTFPVRAADFLGWIKDEAQVNTAQSQQIAPLAPEAWFRTAPVPSTSVQLPADPRRILFVRTDSIGDAVLASGMLAPIRQRYPEAEIAVLCQEHIAELFLACPQLNLVIAFDKAKAARDEAYRTEIISELHTFKPDLILNSIFSREAITEMLVTSCSESILIGLEGDLCNISADARARFNQHYSHLIAIRSEHQTELATHAAFLRALGLPAENLQPQIWVRAEDGAFAERIFQENEVTPDRTIALFPGAQHDCKIFPRLAEAVRDLDGFRFIILGGKDSIPLSQQVETGLPNRCLNLAGQTTLLQMASIIRKCRLFVGSDSAGAHMGCALGVQNVVVLGGGHFGRFFPYSPLTSVVALPLDCYGCNWACRFDRAHCVKDIDPGLVRHAINEALTGVAQKPRLYLQNQFNKGEDAPALRAPDEFIDADAIDIHSGWNPALPADPPILISVIVSTYNAERYIRACLEDLEAQTIADRTEIIVIDSGSPQNERAIVEEFQQRYSNIVYLRTERETLYAAWNRAVQMARGKYITNANSDDSHRADALEKLALALEADSGADLAYGDYFTCTVPNDRFDNPHILRRIVHPPYHPATLLFFCVTGCHPMWRRTVFDKIGLFDPEFTAPGDYEFVLRFAQAGLRAVRVPEVLSLFYQNAEGLSFKSKQRSQQEFDRIQARYRAEMPIERLFKVDPADPIAVADGWVALGNMALRFQVPWFDNVSQDLDYAVTCYERALKSDASNRSAQYNLALAFAFRGKSKETERMLSKLPVDLANQFRAARQSGILQPLRAAIERDSSVVEACSARNNVGGQTATSRSEFLPVVRWVAPFLTQNSYGRDALTLLNALEESLLIGVIDPSKHYSFEYAQSVAEPYGSSLKRAFSNFPLMIGGVAISHGPPAEFHRILGARYHIGRVLEPAGVIPRDWVRACNQMDEIWVPTDLAREKLIAAGVETRKLLVIPSVGKNSSNAAFKEVRALVTTRLKEISQQLDSFHCPAATFAPVSIPSEEGAPSRQLNIAWEGSFLDLGSLSHVNRELTRALATQQGLTLTCVGKNSVPRQFAQLGALKEMAQRLRAQSPRQTEVTIRHAWPPNWTEPEAGLWVLMQPWEFGIAPKEWVRQSRHIHEIWVPSEYVRRVYLDSGFDPDKVKIVPNGIDPTLFRPEAPPLKLATTKRYKFLFVGGTIYRKGPDILLETYLKAFTSADDVCLVIKDFGGAGVYAGQTMADQIKAAQNQPNPPEILYLDSELSPEELPGLYTACDVLVHPYRGEGFGLPVLEAMACGLPVIVTSQGATDDFAPDEFAYRLPARRTAIENHVGGIELVREGWLLEPCKDALVRRMRELYRAPEAGRAKGRAASEYVRREWTWQRSAEIAAFRLRDLVARQQASQQALTLRRSRKAELKELPAVACVGQLRAASTYFAKGELSDAWEAAMDAIRARPFHPEAYLLLANIAHAAGQQKLTNLCLERVRLLSNKCASRTGPAPVNRERAGDKNTPTPSELPEATLPTASTRLTVCMIVKNEERFLARCLESVRPIAQQIVVVDTGSTDSTVQIAKRFGAEVHSFAWLDDFSAARNAALARATGDWVLIIDADEELDSATRDTLPKEMQASNVIAYRLPIIDAGKEAEGCHYVPRLFRNAPGLFFFGRIHEQIFSSIEARRQEWGMETKLGRTRLVHHGYTDEVTRDKNKIHRNLFLLEKVVEEIPNDPNLLMNYGLELVRSGSFEAGLEQYWEAFHLLLVCPEAEIVPELRETLLTQLCTHLHGAKDFAGIARVSQSALAKNAKLSASLHFLFALALMELKQFDPAAQHLRHCLAKRNQPALCPINKEILKAAPRHCLALCLRQLKNPVEARKAFEQALKEDPKSRPVRIDYARFLAEQKDSIESLQLLHQLVSEDPSEVGPWLLGGDMALSNRQFIDFAIDWTGEAIKQFPNHRRIFSQRGHALLVAGRFDEARPVWEHLEKSDSNPRFAGALCFCDWALGNQLTACYSPALEPLVSQALLSWYRAFLDYGSGDQVAALHERLMHITAVLPTAGKLLGAVIDKVATEEIAT